jgi:hypothetical protein
VRGGRDELLASAVELLQLALHVAEGERQLPELVAGVDLDRVAEVAGGDPLGGDLQALDPRGDPARHEVAADERQEQREQAGDEDVVADQRDIVGDVDGCGEQHHPRDLPCVANRVRRLGDRLAV